MPAVLLLCAPGLAHAQVPQLLSIVEIVRAGVFSIDRREPIWPAHGAVALWFARVAWAGEAGAPGAGQPYLLLNLWVPDAPYVEFMRERGYPAKAGDVRLERRAPDALPFRVRRRV